MEVCDLKQCPVCKSYSVVYEEYYKRKMCLKTTCGWSDLSSIHNTMIKAQFNEFEKEVMKGSLLCSTSITINEPSLVFSPSITHEALTCNVNKAKK